MNRVDLLRHKLRHDERLVALAEAVGSEKGRDIALCHMAETLCEIFEACGFAPEEFETVFRLLRHAPELEEQP